MVDVEQLVDPELEGLLRELGSRPRSVFLRSSRKDALRVLRSRTTEGVSALAVSDALERELVTVHRAELAEILKQACQTKLLEGEREKLFVMRYRTATERVDPLPIKEIGERFESASGADVAEPWVGALAAMGSALSTRTLEDISVLDMAALGQKLRPGDSWRVMSAMSQLAVGNGASAREMSAVVLDGWPQVEDALRALEMIAIDAGLNGESARALEIQEQACALKADYPVGQANRLHFSLLALDEGSAMEASDRLEELIDSEHPFIQDANETNRTRWRSGEAAPSGEVRRFALRLHSGLGLVARRLSSAME